MPIIIIMGIGAGSWCDTHSFCCQHFVALNVIFNIENIKQSKFGPKWGQACVARDDD